jgi:hypothetical protein
MDQSILDGLKKFSSHAAILAESSASKVCLFCMSSSRACGLRADIICQAVALKAATEESVIATQKHNDFIRKEMVRRVQSSFVSPRHCCSSLRSSARNVASCFSRSKAGEKWR